jgi:hypothetical protein
MNLKSLFSLLLTVSLLVGCNSYGPKRDIDFKTIKSDLSTSLGVDSIEISDNQNLIISFRSDFEQNQASFENTASIARYLVMDTYSPNILSLDKKVIIKTKDSVGKEYSSSNKVRNIQKLDKFFDKTIINLEAIFNGRYKNDNKIVLNFLNSPCFSKINRNGEISAANIVGMQQTTSKIVTILIVVECGFEQYISMEYDNNLNITEISCYK